MDTASNKAMNTASNKVTEHITYKITDTFLGLVRALPVVNDIWDSREYYLFSIDMWDLYVHYLF